MTKKVLCVDTGELFSSVKAVVKVAGCCYNTLYAAIKNGLKYNDKKYVYVEEPTEPPKQHNGVLKSKQIIDMNSGKVYSSIRDMSRATEIPKSTLSEAIMYNRTVKGYRPIAYDSLSVIEQKKTKKLAKMPRKLNVRCVETGRHYESISECARKLKCPLNWVQSAVYSGAECLGKHYVLDYCGVNQRIKEERIIDVTTDEVWENIRLCSGMLKVPEYQLRRAILKKEIIKGHYLEWLFIYNEDYTEEEKKALKGYKNGK